MSCPIYLHVWFRSRKTFPYFSALARVLYSLTSAAMTVRRNEKRPISDARRNRWEFKKSVDSVGIPKGKTRSEVCHFCSFNRPKSLERISILIRCDVIANCRDLSGELGDTFILSFQIKRPSYLLICRSGLQSFAKTKNDTNQNSSTERAINHNHTINTDGRGLHYCAPSHFYFFLHAKHSVNM